MKAVRYTSRVENSKCVGCKKCEIVCPPGAITVVEKKAQVIEDKCLACTKCWHLCPEKAIDMIPRTEELYVGVEVAEADSQAIEELCQKAHFFPEQFVCACTLTQAQEVAAAVLNGARTPESITLMTGIRSGCSIYCMAPMLRMLKAHGVELNEPENHRWYDASLSIWDISENIQKKYPQYFLGEDKKELPG